MNAKQLAHTLEVVIPSRQPVLIKGSPGTGKTSIVEQVCKKLQAELITMHPVVSDPTDFKGFPFAASNGTEAHFIPYGELNRLARADRLTVCFLDDLGQAPPAVQAAVMQLILARSINGHKVSPQVCFLAATNRKSDKAGVTAILEPVKSRFSTILELEVDHKIWTDWAIDAGMPESLIAFVNYLPEMLTKFVPTSDITNSPSPRTVANAGRLQVQLEKAKLMNKLGFEILSGAVGKEFTAQYMGFRRLYKKLPNPELILNNPETAQIPHKPDVLYALCSALAFKTDRDNADAICRYALRLEGEFSVFLVMTAQRRFSGVVDAPGFITWAEKHGSVLM